MHLMVLLVYKMFTTSKEGIMKKKFIILLFAILMATAGGAAALCACSDGDTATLGAPKNFMISDEFFILTKPRTIALKCRK